jgi:putative transposase
LFKAYKYRIYPTDKQKATLSNFFGCVRFIWNKNVESFKKNDKKFKSSTELKKQFTFLNNVSAAILQQKEIDFKRFKKHFFNKNKKVKIKECTFKNKDDKQSFRLPNQKFKIVNNRLQIEKVGKISIVFDRMPEGKHMSVTISKSKTEQYYATIITKQEIVHKQKTGVDIGIDLGVRSLITTSEGVQIKRFIDNQNKIKHLQRHLQRKIKGSLKFKRIKFKISKLYEKDSRRRTWLNHNISSYLIKNYDIIVIEDLNISGMLKNHKLAGSIQKSSWFDLISKIEYKCNFYGKTLIKINRFYPSSKTCSRCSSIKKDLKLSDKVFKCNKCEFISDRDLNAAKNIMSVGVNADSRSMMEHKTNIQLKNCNLAIPNDLITFL